MYDGVATLISYGAVSYDSAGNEKLKETEREIFVQPRGVYQSEFYNAAQVGLKPSLTLDIANMDDYTGERVLIYEGRKYDVIRIDWSAQRDRISLICEERIGDHPAPKPIQSE